MRFLKRFVSWLALAGLAACGGGGGSGGTSPLLPPQVTPPTAADLVIVLSNDRVNNSGTATVTATVTAVDANRVGVAKVPVTISANNNGVVTLTSSDVDAANAPVTNASGQMTATIGIGSDRTTRDITITARSGSVTKTAVLRVVEETTTGPAASDLTLTLSAPSITNGGSSTIVATATAVDANRNAVPGIDVTISVDQSAVAQVSGTRTNAQGVVTANIGIGADRSNRVVTVTAKTGSLVRTASFAVTGAKLTSSASPLVTAGSEGNVIEYTLVDFNGIAMANQRVEVTGAGLVAQSGTTDLNGKFRYTYRAPANPTTLQIIAAAAGDTRTENVTVASAGSGVPEADEKPQSASVTPTPSVVTVNVPGSTTNQVELRALFLGANNRPIKNVRVRFDLAGNQSNTDGRATWVGDYAYSDENGVARGTFTPGLRSSPTNGVTIRACYDTRNFVATGPSACDGVPSFTMATLTVSSEALAVSIRTNELIKSGAALLTYIKEYVVMVVDSAGQAKQDVLITPSIDLTAFYKGFYRWNGVQWARTLTLDAAESYEWTGAAWSRVGPTTPARPACPNDDVNRNGVREAAPFVAGAAVPGIEGRQEDLNWNGELDPRKSDVAIKVVGSNKTDANGIAIVQIEYGRNLASWVDFVITVTASGVSGTEARARYIGSLYGLGNLPFPGEAVTNENVAPAFVVSPYGRSTTCLDAN